MRLWHVCGNVHIIPVDNFQSPEIVFERVSDEKSLFADRTQHRTSSLFESCRHTAKRVLRNTAPLRAVINYLFERKDEMVENDCAEFIQ